MKRLFAFLAIPAGLVVQPAQAADLDDQVTVAIPYDGLGATDLTDVRRRIRMAADRLCLDPNGPSPAVTVNLVCRAELERDALSQLDGIIGRQPRLAALTIR